VAKSLVAPFCFGGAMLVVVDQLLQIAVSASGFDPSMVGSRVQLALLVASRLFPFLAVDLILLVGLQALGWTGAVRIWGRVQIGVAVVLVGLCYIVVFEGARVSFDIPGHLAAAFVGARIRALAGLLAALPAVMVLGWAGWRVRSPLSISEQNPK
jgi:hypothetical protein